MRGWWTRVPGELLDHVGAAFGAVRCAARLDNISAATSVIGGRRTGPAVLADAEPALRVLRCVAVLAAGLAAAEVGAEAVLTVGAGLLAWTWEQASAPSLAEAGSVLYLLVRYPNAALKVLICGSALIDGLLLLGVLRATEWPL